MIFTNVSDNCSKAKYIAINFKNFEIEKCKIVKKFKLFIFKYLCRYTVLEYSKIFLSCRNKKFKNTVEITNYGMIKDVLVWFKSSATRVWLAYIEQPCGTLAGIL